MGSNVSRPGRAEEKAPVMQLRNVLASALALGLVLGVSTTAASAQGKQNSVQNEAKFVSFDEAANTVTVTILKKGKGNRKLIKQFNKQVKNGKDTTFNVIPTGSVLKRTSVAVNGVKGEMTDLKPGKTLQVYWVEDPNKKGELFARKIDVVLSEEELNKRYEVVEE
jgi:archaellum component FlaG (FlaF/FlaG flagellin family)